MMFSLLPNRSIPRYEKDVSRDNKKTKNNQDINLAPSENSNSIADSLSFTETSVESHLISLRVRKNLQKNLQNQLFIRIKITNNIT